MPAGAGGERKERGRQAETRDERQNMRGGKRNRENEWEGRERGKNGESKSEVKKDLELNWSEPNILINILCQDKLIKHGFLYTSNLLFSEFV